MTGQFREPERLGVPDELAEDAVAGGQVADLGPEVVADADGKELGELLVVTDDAQRSVLRVHQDDSGFDDAPPYLWQIEAPPTDHGIEEPVEPVPGAAHLVDTDLELFEQFVQTEPWKPRTHRALHVPAHAYLQQRPGEVRPANSTVYLPLPSRAG
ncbi:hypothetical protein ACFY0G_40915 [Streptomyces sp. NPDC001552]|uniref:hypothetical protein n=1 Tax=Streptomyces sp. NPDC001552 TaxID=3364587 RepID=UPI00369893B0